MSVLHIIALPFALVFFVLLIRFLYERSRPGRLVTTFDRTQDLIGRADALHRDDQAEARDSDYRPPSSL